MIFTCVGLIFAGEFNPNISKLFCKSPDRQKLHRSFEEMLYVMKSDTERIRLLSISELEEQTVDVTEKIDKKAFEQFYPGRVIVHGVEDDSDERGLGIGGFCTMNGCSPLDVGTVSYRCLDENFGLHIRLH